MKKILSLLFLVVLFQSCDDGDLTVERIDFSDVTTSSCGETLYKLNGNEALYLKIPASFNAFRNEVTPSDQPRTIPIGSSVSVTYRAYNGSPSAGNICNTPGPISPVATTEWTATAGNIEIRTTAVYTTNEATGATRISRYSHAISFKNIIFSKPEGTQIYDTFNFGEFSTTPTSLPFNFSPDDLKLCTTNNVLYNARINGIEGLSIQNFNEALLSTSNLGVPKRGLITGSSNTLTYRLFTTALTTSDNSNYFCPSTFPDFPPTSEIWVAQNGIENVSGIIEVTTTTNGTGYLHSILLKGVTFQKGNDTFYFGDAILLGNLLTTD